MKLGSRTGFAAASALVAAALVLTGCHSKSEDHTSSNGGSSPEATKLLNDGATAMDSVKGVHLALDVEGKVTNFPVKKLAGDLTNTPQPAADGTATLIVGQEDQNIKFVYVDGHMYSDLGDPGGAYTDFGDGRSIYNVSNILDPAKGIANVLKNIKDAKVDGTADVDGVATTKVTGTSSTEDIANMGGARYAPKGDETMPTTVWIASDGTNHPVKVEITPVPDATITLGLSEWGKQVTVTKPEV